MKLSKKHYVIGGLTAVALVAAALMPELAQAQAGGIIPEAVTCGSSGSNSGGEGLLKDVIRVINGPFGATIGLVISLFGAYQWLVNQSTWGLVILAGGALLTVFPNVYENLLSGLCDMLPNTAVEGGRS